MHVYRNSVGRGEELYGLHMGVCFAGTGLAELNIVLSPAHLHIVSLGESCTKSTGQVVSMGTHS